MERAAMRKGLRSAQQSVQRLSLQNERLHALLAEVQKEHQRMASAKEQVPPPAHPLTVAAAHPPASRPCNLV